MKPRMDGDGRRAAFLGDQRGFTLLETILAMSIVVVIVGVLLMAMRLGISSWDKGESYVEATSAKRYLVEMLVMDVSSIYPYAVDSPLSVTDEKDFVFFGKPHSIVFVTAARTSVTGIPWGGFRWVRYGVDEGGLKIREKTVPSDAMLEEDGGAEFALEPGVSGIDFSYYGDDGWQESWDMAAKQKLPGAVKAKISFKDGRTPLAMTMPVSIMQPMSNASAAGPGK